MMIEEFVEAQATLRKGGPRWWWDEAPLNDVQREAVLQAFARPDVSDRAVRIVLGNWGVNVTLAQVAHLRRKVQNG
jgi:hypothetical protein